MSGRSPPPSERREALEPKHLRTCVGCRLSAPKGQLLRLVAGTRGVSIDPAMRQPGRGAYIHRTEGCATEAIRRGALARALRVGIEREEASNLLREILGYLQGRELIEKT
jgi:uncharacterized protein